MKIQKTHRKLDYLIAQVTLKRNWRNLEKGKGRCWLLCPWVEFWVCPNPRKKLIKPRSTKPWNWRLQTVVAWNRRELGTMDRDQAGRRHFFPPSPDSECSLGPAWKRLPRTDSRWVQKGRIPPATSPCPDTIGAWYSQQWEHTLKKNSTWDEGTPFPRGSFGAD